MKRFFWFLGVVFFVLILFSVIFRGLGPTENLEVASGNIGVIEIEGVIIESLPVLEQIQTLKEHKNLKALVVRIDSPGGAVGAAQEIYLELKKLREDFPVIVSMGNIAASGGLYASLGGDVVLALPGTLTGSMGVLLQVTNLSKLAKRVYMEPITIKSGELKDAGNPLHPMKPGTRRFLEGMIDKTFEQFKEHVVSERKLKPAAIKELSDGRVVSGSEAVKLGLVDEIGSFQDAVDLAAEKANIEKVKLAFLSRKPVTFVERLVQEMAVPVREMLESKVHLLEYRMDTSWGLH